MKQILLSISIVLILALMTSSCKPASVPNTITVNYYFTAPSQEYGQYGIFNGMRLSPDENGILKQENYQIILKTHQFPNLSIQRGILSRMPDPVRLAISKTNHPQIWTANYQLIGDEKKSLIPMSLGQVKNSKPIESTYIPRAGHQRVDGLYETLVDGLSNEEVVTGYSKQKLEIGTWVIIGEHEQGLYRSYVTPISL